MLYNCRGNGDNFWCHNGAGPSDVISKLSSRPKIEPLFAIYEWHGNNDNFWCPVRSKLSSRPKIEPLFAIYEWHGNNDNFWCRNGAYQPLDRTSLRDLQLPQFWQKLLVSYWGPSGVRLKLSSQPTTATGTVTTFGIEMGPISHLIEALFVIYNCHGNGKTWCRNGAHQPLDQSSVHALQPPRERQQLLES
ncbi:hypothetical protein L484_000529 [Morus notabilis]|uniref:Uncharacterized protein n=1 Tax=Morus notabilis TaxID=981085 RepID=W9SF35_9ROSA|nr:hypothetical protein L484_000529 [Morus notabilis]